MEHHSDRFPAIYKFDLLVSDIRSTFEEIFSDCNVKEAIEILSEYIHENIEPIGWTAVWQPKNSARFSTEICIKVQAEDVDYRVFKAHVKPLEIYYPIEGDVSEQIHREVHDFFAQNEIILCDLTELSIIAADDPEEIYFESSTVIDITRIFFADLLRPWEDVDESYWSMPFDIAARLDFFFNVEMKVLPVSTIQEYHAIRDEARSLKDRVDEINQQAAKQDADERDVVRLTRCKIRLAQLARKMDILTNPAVGHLYFAIQLPIEENRATISGSQVHLIVQNATFDKLSLFMKQVDELLKHSKRNTWQFRMHGRIADAINQSKSGDALYIAPGDYHEPLPWIEKNIELIGFGDSADETCIHSSSRSAASVNDALLFLDTDDIVSVVNLTLKVDHHLKNVLRIARGKVSLINCQIDCSNNVSCEPILTLGDSKFHKDEYSEFLNCSSLEKKAKDS